MDRRSVRRSRLSQFLLDEFFGVSNPIDGCARRTVVCPMDHRCHRWLHVPIFWEKKFGLFFLWGVTVYFYVDDIFITKRNISVINATNNINMKDIEVTDVIENVLDKFKHLDFSIVETTINVRFVLQKNEDKSESQMDSDRELRSMMYIMKCA